MKQKQTNKKKLQEKFLSLHDKKMCVVSSLNRFFIRTNENLLTKWDVRWAAVSAILTWDWISFSIHLSICVFESIVPACSSIIFFLFLSISAFVLFSWLYNIHTSPTLHKWNPRKVKCQVGSHFMLPSDDVCMTFCQAYSVERHHKLLPTDTASPMVHHPK